MNGYLRCSRATLLQLSAEDIHGSFHGVSEETMKFCLEARAYIQLGARASAVKFLILKIVHHFLITHNHHTQGLIL